MIIAILPLPLRERGWGEADSGRSLVRASPAPSQGNMTLYANDIYAAMRETVLAALRHLVA